MEPCAWDEDQVMSNDRMFEVMEVGQFTPKRTKKTELLTGEVGYLCAEHERSRGRQIGDTLTGRGVADARAITWV